MDVPQQVRYQPPRRGRPPKRREVGDQLSSQHAKVIILLSHIQV